MAQPPTISILGAGTFVRNQYIPRLTEISNLVTVKSIWSRTEVNYHFFSVRHFIKHIGCVWFNGFKFPWKELSIRMSIPWKTTSFFQKRKSNSLISGLARNPNSLMSTFLMKPNSTEISLSRKVLSEEGSARAAVEIACKYFPNVECKWGDEGLDDIMKDESVLGVAVVLAGQAQVDMSLKMLKAGKHVIQEKPAAAYVSEAETALSQYDSLSTHVSHRPIWAVAENYRFEPAFVESKKLVNDIGDMMSVQVIVEGSMNSKNPYFSSSWRRDFTGGFILDMGVHFIAGLRMVVGCEIDKVSAVTSHIDTSLPPPDNISALFQLENGCAGVFVMIVSSSAPKILWRVVGSKATLQIERGNKDGQHGYTVLFYNGNGQTQSSFYPFSGVTEELKAFIHDISQANTLKGEGSYAAEPRSSFVEGARDIAVLEAMLESGTKHGSQVTVKKF